MLVLNVQLLSSNESRIRSKFTYTTFLAGWWFGTWMLFSHIFGIIIPIDELIFFRGFQTTNQLETPTLLEPLGEAPPTALINKIKESESGEPTT